ncbi:unnamed protein product [Blepharisma stoltei]|uniref:Receptor ligand binding region domain-containing protein n=1 Tax=Blepharisma stoltei TaxID=1481888 RepID=A0AAU9K6D0_9CILI|nr:unnamed protein product [Blepharisma stoltei]
MEFYLLFLSISTLASVELLIFYGEMTPVSLISYFQANLAGMIGNPNIFEIVFVLANSQTNFISSLKGDIQIAIDATFDITLSHRLLTATEEQGIINLYLDSNLLTNGELQYYAHVPLQSQLAIMQQFLDYLGWNEITIIGSNSQESLALSDKFVENTENRVKLKLLLTESSNIGRMNDIAGKIFKLKGLQIFMVLCEGNYISNIIISFANKKLYKAGLGILIWSQGIWGGSENGLLYLVEQGLEAATSYEQYEALSIKFFTNSILEYIENLSSNELPRITNDSLKQFIQSNWPNHGKPQSYSIINIVNSTKKIVGTASNALISISSDPIYPGNTTNKPTASKATLYMSLTTSGKEPDGSFNSYQPVQAQGNFFARDWINNSSLILENFHIKFVENSCGTMSFIKNIDAACYSPLKEKLGVVFLTSDYVASVVGIIMLFREWNISLPHIAPGPSSPLLSNKTNYPEFMRVAPNGNYNAVVILRLCQIFAWKNVNVLYANSSSNIAMYQTFASEAQKGGITIANGENERILPANYDRTQFSNYKHIFQAIKNTNVKIFISFQTANSNYQSIEGLYDIGLRKGNLVIILPSKTGGQAIIQNYAQAYLPKLLELLTGSISVGTIEYIGEFGLKIKKAMTDYWGNSPNFKATHFDQTLLAAYGLDFTINKGDDFENATILAKNARLQRFTGASGSIAIDSTSNDRSFMILGINNFYTTNSTGIYNESVAGYYIPTSSIPIQLSTNIIWPGPSYTLPHDSVVIDSECGFDKSKTSKSVKGIAVFTTICGAVSLLAVLIAFYTWKRKLVMHYPKLVEAREIQFADSVIMMTLLVETFQYINIGPKVKNDPATRYLSSLINIDITMLKSSAYWIGLDIVLGIVCFWLLMCLLAVSKNRAVIQNVFILRWLYEVKNYLMPLLGNMLFIPIINILLTVPKCSKSIGDELDESYMDINCKEFCWKETHLTYAIVCAFSLALYIPISVIYRPLWTNLQGDYNQNIRPQPGYLIVKSAAQIIFVTLNKIISLHDSITQGFAYLCFLIIFTVYIIKHPPFNYERLSMWHVVALFCVSWSILLASLSLIVDQYDLGFMIAKLAGWGIMIVYGLFLHTKKYPALLIRQPPQNISVLFRFMLTSSVRADEIEKKNLRFENGGIKLEEHAIDALSFDKIEIAENIENDMTSKRDIIDEEEGIN